MKKRLFDVAVVSLAALVWVPVVAVTSVAVLVLSGRPVFYKSRRWVNPHGAITMAKFRVMIRDANKVVSPIEAGRFLNTPSDSPLYTGIGRVLERLGITELPQLIHVLLGEMTIVGPRPLTDVVRECLLEQHPDLDERWMYGRAGLTGLPQLVGREVLTDSQRLQLEEAYDRAAATGYRMSTDFMILLYTVLIVLKLKRPMTFQQALGVLATTPQRRTVTAHEPQASYAADADAVA
ncbi:MAG: sugar transferase [Nocardioidaceae bacterium]|nr:sugar transferase [Nocardioidaceae bacterium]MCL2614157.1 sugar transferase [Nocardioidaceae bacterium]